MSEAPRLIHLARAIRVVDFDPPAFTTPLGNLQLNLAVGGLPVSPTAAYSDGEKSLFVWTTPIRFELLLLNPPIELPPDMAVDGLLAAVYRFDSIEGLNGVVIECIWADGATPPQSGPETGENLDAYSWTDGQKKVTVGLRDYEDATTYLTPTTYRADGFEVALAGLKDREGHFLCAWSPDTPDDISTWFAVDCPTAWLLREVE